MKKLLVLITAMVLSLSLAACGAGVDKTAVTEAFNKANEAHVAVGTLVNENLDKIDPEIVQSLTDIAGSLAEYKALIESDKLVQETADDVTAKLKLIPDDLNALKTLIEELLAAGGDATGYPEGVTKEHVDALSAIYAELAPLYNEASKLATDNGWLEDPTTTAELTNVGTILQATAAGLKDVTEFAGIEDMDAYIESLKIFAPAMPEIIERVSATFRALEY